MGLNYKVHKQWLNTPKGRASTLLNAYNNKDKKQNRGKGNLTSQLIVENILFKPCAHCGISGWKIIGCNSIDNDKPHTKDNVEPCCKECNDKLATKERKTQVYQYTLDDKLVKVWDSQQECKKSGFSQSNISNCCNGKMKNYKGYKWSFNPL